MLLLRSGDVEELADPRAYAGVEPLADVEFFSRRVLPFVFGGVRTARPLEFGVTFQRRRQDGRAVAEYTFEGARVREALSRSRRGQPRAPDQREPVDARVRTRLTTSSSRAARVPRRRRRVLLMRAAPGERFTGADALDNEALQRCVKRAARWLVALHASPLRVGSHDDIAQGNVRLARRAANASACRPDLDELFRRALRNWSRAVRWLRSAERESKRTGAITSATCS